MLFEEIYEYTGQFGKYQFCLLIETMVVAFFAGDAFAILFINNKQDHWCNIPELNNLSSAQQKYIGIPYTIYGEEQKEYSRCERFTFDYSKFSFSDFETWNRSDALRQYNPVVVPCNASIGWSFKNNKLGLVSIVQRFLLVCENDHYINRNFHVSFAGVTLSGLLSGITVDSLGRMSAFALLLFIKLVASILSILSTSYVTYLIFRFVVCFSSIGICLASVILVFEQVGRNYRATVISMIQMSYILGVMLTAVMVTQSPVSTELLMVFPTLAIIYHVFVLEESPRWLYVNDNIPQALTVIKNIATVNNKKAIPESKLILKPISGSVKKSGIIEMFTVNPCFYRSFSLCYIWMTTMTIYFTSFYWKRDLSSKSTLPKIIMVIFMEIPMLIIGCKMMDSNKFGRRYSLVCIFLMSCGSSLIGIVFIAFDFQIGISIIQYSLQMLSVLGCTVAHTYSLEYFPTQVRATGMGICLIVATGIPLFLISFRENTDRMYVLFSAYISSTLICAILSCLLPETLDENIPDIISDAMKFSGDLWKMNRDILIELGTDRSDRKLHRDSSNRFSLANPLDDLAKEFEDAQALEDVEHDEKNLCWQERDYRKSMRRSSAVTGSSAKSFAALKLKTMALIKKQSVKVTNQNRSSITTGQDDASTNPPSETSIEKEYKAFSNNRNKRKVSFHATMVTDGSLAETPEHLDAVGDLGNSRISQAEETGDFDTQVERSREEYDSNDEGTTTPNEYFQRTMTRKEIWDAIYNTSMMTSGVSGKPNEKFGKQSMPKSKKSQSSNRKSTAPNTNKEELVVARDLITRDSISKSRAPQQALRNIKSSIVRNSSLKEASTLSQEQSVDNSQIKFKARDSIHRNSSIKSSLSRSSKDSRNDSLKRNPMSKDNNISHGLVNIESERMDPTLSRHKSTANGHTRNSIRKYSLRRQSIVEQPNNRADSTKRTSTSKQVFTSESEILNPVTSSASIVPVFKVKESSSIISIPNFKARDSIRRNSSRKSSIAKQSKNTNELSSTLNEESSDRESII